MKLRGLFILGCFAAIGCSRSNSGAGDSGGTDDLATADFAAGDLATAGNDGGESDGGGDGPAQSDMPKPAAMLSFAPAALVGAGTDVRGIATADFNGDTRPDIATANWGSLDVSVILVGAGGVIAAPKSTAIGKQCWGIAAGDATNDDKADIAVGCVNMDGTLAGIYVAPGKGDGTLDMPVNYPVPGPDAPYYGRIESVRLGDLNGDKRIDIAYTHVGGAHPALVSLVATLNQTFIVKGPFEGWNGGSTATYPRAVALADFTGDGVLDAVVADQRPYDNSGNGGRGHLVQGNGDGTFGGDTVLNAGSGSGAVYVVTAADINSDTKPDAVFGDSYVDVLLGNGGGTFQARKGTTTGSQLYDVITADFDGDGVLDVATANFTTKMVTVLRGKGDGTFPTSMSLPAGASPYSLVAADFNGDGRPDIAVASGTDGVQLIFNTSM